MRLIDADKLLDLIATENQRCITSTGHELTVKIIRDFINSQPTAYDVDKVVEQICGCDGCSYCCNCHEEERMQECEEYERVYSNCKGRWSK